MMTQENNQDGKNPAGIPGAPAAGAGSAAPTTPAASAEAPKPLAGTPEIMDWLRPVQDPELFLSIVDLGLIYEATIDDKGLVDIRMTLTSPGCPAGDYIITELTRRAKEHPQVKDANVQIVWEPKWDPATMASDEVKDRLGIW